MQAGILEGKCVLVVEDSWHISAALKMTLEAEGVRVVGPAPTVRKARLLLDEAEVDAALVDMNLRGELCHPLLEALEARGINSVVLSGYRNVSGLGAHTVAVLAKPVESDRLLDAMQRAVAEPG